MPNLPDNSSLQLENFMPYRLSILTNRVSDIIAGIYKDKFSLSTTEWRIMAILGQYPGISADDVSRKARIEKSILSRAIAKLLTRKLIERETDGEDRRRSILTLSGTGAAVYAEIIPISLEYERKVLACFTESELKQLDELITRLDKHVGELEAVNQ